MTGAIRTATLMCALIALSWVSAAAATPRPDRFSGKTSQGAPISFVVSTDHLRQLHFTIFVKCPSRHIYRISASDFPPIVIRRGSFAQKFVARGNTGSATVKGRISASRVSGTLSDRTFEPGEHRYCAAATRFSLRR